MTILGENKWIIAAFVSAAVSLFITFFLEGEVQTFAYVIAAMVFALFVIIQSQIDQREQKRKN